MFQQKFADFERSQDNFERDYFGFSTCIKKYWAHAAKCRVIYPRVRLYSISCSFIQTSSVKTVISKSLFLGRVYFAVKTDWLVSMCMTVDWLGSIPVYARMVLRKSANQYRYFNVNGKIDTASKFEEHAAKWELV